MKPIQIFKPGQHITAGGDALNFSESDVLAMVAAYDPATHEAPIVVGHPRHDGPAYGWIKSLSFSDGILNAEPHQIDLDFAEMVDKKRFKKVSASFYHPESPSNPKPGAYYLRHVGFLGAQPPAVKGLRNPEFNEGDENVISIEFSEESYSWSNLADMFRRLREYVIGKDGTDKADQLIPNWQIDQLQRTAQESQQEEDENGLITPSPAFSEPPTGVSMTPEQIAALQAENARLKASADQVAARESELAIQAEKQAGVANVAFCESLVASAQLHPSQKDNAIALLNGLSVPAAAQSPAVVEFSEGTAKTAMPLADAFKALLQAQPKIVEFGESGKPRGAATDFDDPNALAAKAIEFQESERAAGREINTAQAVEQISRKI
ncbi:peptidase [Undibacterium sp. SXout11W]|uniref:peptidase n=1 Tax=Undibacterium sp. SXout11W TaxID=3413050 RepID=UPI003BF195DF